MIAENGGGCARNFWLGKLHGCACGFILNRKGVSAIEFAIVAPVFIVLLLGSMAFGMYLGAGHSVAQLTADAARASVAGLDDAERAMLARQHVARNAAGFPLVDASRISVETGPSPLDSNSYRVVLRYDASHLPIWSFAGLVPMPAQTVERVAVIRRGGF